MGGLFLPRLFFNSACRYGDAPNPPTSKTFYQCVNSLIPYSSRIGTYPNTLPLSCDDLFDLLLDQFEHTVDAMIHESLHFGPEHVSY